MLPPGARPLLLGLLLLAPSPAGAGAAAAAPADPQTEALRRETTLLRRELELAASAKFYLRLDAQRGSLALMLKGVVLDDYALVSLESASPRVLFVPRRPTQDWTLRSYSKGRLAPERERDRIEIVVAAPAPEASPSPPAVPQTAEESYSVPSPFRIEFDEGLSLEIAAPGGAALNRSWLRRGGDRLRLRWRDWRAALSSGAADRVRLRAELAAADAAALYRSLPPDVALLVVGLPAP